MTGERDTLRKTLQAERLAAVTTLVAGLAHEIRNPLNAAQLQLDVLEARVERGQTDAASLFPVVATVRDELRRLGNLLSDLLSFARPPTLELRRVDLNELLTELAGFERTKAARLGVALELVLDPAVGHVTLDLARIREAVANLIENAIEAAGEGGRIWLSVRALPGLPDAKARIDQIVAANATIEWLFENQVLPLVRAGDRAALTVFEERILHLAMEAQSAEELARKTEEAKEDLSKEFRDGQRRAVLSAILAQVLALATAVIVGILLYRSIARPISTLSTAAARVGAGDLETEVRIERSDELGQLARRFNQMTRAIKEDRAKLLQTERLAGLGRMAAGIAHEINNPIGVILGYAKLSRHRGAGADPKMLEVIEQEAERCHQVIEGLLDLTRSSVHALRTTTVDLWALTERVATCSELTGRAPGVSVEIHGKATVVGDEIKLRQVLVNLVGNAVEACGPSGRVVVLIEQSEPDLASVTVGDTGPGIDPSHGTRIFDPFFTTKSNGTGLGLPISRAIARAHGGDVALLQNGGTGATFLLTLPTTPRPVS